MKYNLYLFYSDESATLLDFPVLRDVPKEIVDFTSSQMIQIIMALDYNGELSPEDMKGWSVEKLSQAIWDVYCLILDSYAIIPAEHEDKILTIGDSLSNSFGSDSSTYAACASFAEVLKAFSVSTGVFPVGDSDLDYEDME